jgi:outer membrane protein OmpA-like peptidoglycan-associated protein
MAKLAVAVLILIAIAGFVLAGLKQRAAVPEQSAAPVATQDTAAAPTAPASAGGEDAGAAPNHIGFAPGSDRVSEAATAKIALLADKAKKAHLRVAISSDVEARADRSEQLALARRRGEAVRQVLVTNGIPLAMMRIEIHEVPSGAVAPSGANLLVVALQ